MTARSFEPKFMKMSVLTAALQELTPRRIRDEDPDRAIEDWLAFARELDCPNIQISAALHPTETDVPPEAMLDPVANTLDLRKPFDKARAKRVLAAMQATGVGATDIAFFDNLLHDDNDLRKKKHDFVVRMMDAAALLGLEAVCGFVGRNQKLSMDQNLLFFEEVFIPLLKEAKARRLEYRVEQCPMPGWTVGDNFHNNIAYAPGMWIALHRICERHGVGDQFRVHYDPSHAILMGQDTRSIFQYLKDEGYDFIIGGFHVKGQVIDSKGVAGWGYGGQTAERGDWMETGKPSPNPADHVNAWKKQTAISEHELPGTAQARSPRVPAKPHRRLAGSSARRPRAPEAGRRAHGAGDRARIPAGAHPGQGAARADPGGLDRLRPQDRRGGSVHVRASPRGAAGAGDPRARARPRRLTGPEDDDDGEAQVERRDDRVRLHGPGAFERLAPGRPVFSGLPVDPVLKVVVGRTEAKVKEAAARLGFEEHATSWQEVLARKDIDVVDICTPGDSHAPIAVAAAEAGKAILCEKPLANTVAEAERMNAAVKKAGVVNMVCHNYRRCPAVALAKQLIDDGQLGDIHHYRGLYLQDWIVDPKFPRVWRLEKARGRLGIARRHPLAHDGSVALPRRRAGRGVGLVEDVHRRAAAARRSRAPRQGGRRRLGAKRWSSSRTARSATTKARASRPAARTTTGSRSTARRAAWSGISSG